MSAAAVWPPVPAGAPVFGSLFALRRDPIGFLTRSSEEFGDSVHFRVGPRTHAVFFRHPDQVKDVLVTHQHSFAKGRGLQWAKQFLGEGLLTSEGEFHRRQRRLSQQRSHVRLRDPARRAAYFPFGGGARQCIGEPFAWMEGVLILATLAQQWRLRLVPGHRVDAQPLITLRPRYGMRMVPEGRESSPGSGRPPLLG